MDEFLEKSLIVSLVKKTLEEDIFKGDITTRNIFSLNKPGVAKVIAREPIILCGLEILKATIIALRNPLGNP